MEGSNRWGELVDGDSANFTSPYLLSFDEVEKLSKCFVATSPAKNIKPETTIVTQMMPVSYFSMDILTQHNIQLVVYIKKMQDLALQIQNSYMKTDTDTIPPIPAPPVQSQIQHNSSLQLTRKGAQQLLHKAMFDICVHEGFHCTSESVLSVLKDVAEEMIIKFCSNLKINTEREQLKQSTGFSDALEHTLHEVGINGIKDLNRYYINRIRSYNERLRQQAEQMRQACITAAAQWTKKSASRPSWEDSEWTEWSGNDQNGDDSFRIRRDSTTVEHLTESSSNGEAVHQLHLEDNPTVLTPSLEPGLRMLYTLEQEAAAGVQGSGGVSDDFSGLLTSPSAASASATTSTSPHQASANKNGNRKRRKI